MNLQDLYFSVADRTGLEPATSAVTGRHSNQLNYRSKIRSANIMHSVFYYQNIIGEFGWNLGGGHIVKYICCP